MKRAFTAGLICSCLALAWAAAAPAADKPTGMDSFGVVVAVPVPGGGALYFEAGRWYRQEDGDWVSCPGTPEGPWLVVPKGALPPALIELPQLREALPAQPPETSPEPGEAPAPPR